MSPTLEEGDWVAADKDAYKHSQPVAGDLIVFRKPGNPNESYLKRCVALSGQTVQIRDGLVYVDGNRFMPTLLTKRTRSYYLPTGKDDKRIYPPGAGNEDNYGPVTVPKDSLFVLGDNRDNSLDSRYFGFVHANALLAKALFIYWSHDISRIGKKAN
jgi:signal peptidase I